MPMLRASFEKRGREWQLSAVRPIATSEIPESHRAFLVQQAEQHFGRRQRPSRARRTYRYDLAILHQPRGARRAVRPEGAAPVRARRARGSASTRELIDHDDASDIAEFDALFIRETTYVNHPTYRLSRRAATEGLVVIDDPISILRCTNKVFLAELFDRNAIPHPETVVAHEDTVEKIAATVGLPVRAQAPRLGVLAGRRARRHRGRAAGARAADFLRDSELVIAQEFTPSEFDWRIGVLGGEALYACRYHMAQRPLADRRARGAAGSGATGGSRRCRSTTRRPRRCASPCARRG